MSRSLRRHHEARKKQAARKYHGGMGHIHPEHEGKVLGIRAHTPQMCSCAGCGNPRKHFHEPTMQERRLEPVESILKESP